jgi:hypothetical protein
MQDSTLDQKSPGSSPGGATESPTSRQVRSGSFVLQQLVSSWSFRHPIHRPLEAFTLGADASRRFRVSLVTASTSASSGMS